MQLHKLQGYIQHIFLVEYPHALMLLDGACRADFHIVREYIENILKRPLSDLNVVMVTHMHPDHAGCAQLFREKTNCKIVSGPVAEDWYAGISGRFAHLTDIILAQWVAKKIGKKRRFIWYPRMLNADIKLNDGESVPGFEDWQVISTPGHTSMDISIANAKEKIIYVADLNVKIKDQLHPPFPVHFPIQYKHSLNRMHDFADYTVLMAHVESQKLQKNDITALIEKAPSKAQNSKQAITSMLRKMLGMSFTSARK